jgi:hypothetical protein
MKKSQLRRIIREEIENIKGGGDLDQLYSQILSLTAQLQSISEKNIGKAENFDLEDFSQVLDRYVDELRGIGGFEFYGEDY